MSFEQAVDAMMPASAGIADGTTLQPNPALREGYSQARQRYAALLSTLYPAG